MSRRVARGLLVASVVAVLLSAPAAGSACECLDRLWPWNWGRGTQAATTYAPPFTPAATVAPPFTPSCAPACAPCATACNPCVSQTCSYVPQTCYRQVCAMAPVTTCQAVTSCDPCTGCPVTSYRPVTVYQRTTQLIPYTTYRMVWSNPCATAPCATSCAPCGASTYAPAASYAAPALGGSSCCGARMPVSSAAPLMPSPDPASTGTPPITFAPSSPAPNGGATLPPVQSRNMPIDDPKNAPKPDDGKVQQNSVRNPPLDAPMTNNQTAFRPIRQVQYVSDSRLPRPAAATTTTGPVDFGGWRASTD